MSEIPNLPKGHSVLHSSTARFPMQNVTCKVHKIYDTANDSDYQLCFDQKNNKIDFDQHFKKELELYTKKYGKLHPVLFDTLHKNPGQPVEVMA
jgi:hypothetical protein